MKVNKKNKIIIVGIIVALLISSLFVILVNKNYDYKKGIEGGGDINGAYSLNAHTFLSVEYSKELKEFYFVKDNEVVKSGSVEKSENSYILYDKVTKELYGKAIPSYKKIYFIEKGLDISEFYFYSKELIIPSE